MPSISKILAVSGLCLLILALNLATSARDFIERSLLVEGMILRVERQYFRSSQPEDGEGVGMRYVYIIWFPTESGKSIAIRRKTGDARPYFRRGDLVPIRYERDAPNESARIATFGNLWGTSLLAAGAGSAFLIFAAGLAGGRRGSGSLPS